jgi:hypothetical protein
MDKFEGSNPFGLVFSEKLLDATRVFPGTPSAPPPPALCGQGASSLGERA